MSYNYYCKRFINTSANAGNITYRSMYDVSYVCTQSYAEINLCSATVSCAKQAKLRCSIYFCRAVLILENKNIHHPDKQGEIKEN